jgi:pimeloyl-ACP methyl ester carboxylesterase
MSAASPSTDVAGEAAGKMLRETGSMIEDELSGVEYEESGSGPAIIFVPGSCSTGAAWRPILAALTGRFRCVTTSLLGYGRTVERRTASDPSINHEAVAVEAVIRRAGGRVHLVGHSFGGLVALAVALRHEVPLASLTIIEAPAVELLRDRSEQEHYRTFRQMSDAYFADYAGGNPQAVAAMIDFYGGTGTFASWPAKVQDYTVRTTPVNIRDWACAYGFPLSAVALGSIDVPVLVIRGSESPQAVQRANELLCECTPGASVATVEAAAHFMIATHAGAVARLIADHVMPAG